MKHEVEARWGYSWDAWGDGQPAGCSDHQYRSSTVTYDYGTGLRIFDYDTEGGSNVPVRIAYDFDKMFNTLSITEPRGRYVESYQLDLHDRVVAVTNIEGQAMSIGNSSAAWFRKPRASTVPPSRTPTTKRDAWATFSMVAQASRLLPSPTNATLAAKRNQTRLRRLFLHHQLVRPTQPPHQPGRAGVRSQDSRLKN